MPARLVLTFLLLLMSSGRGEAVTAGQRAALFVLGQTTNIQLDTEYHRRWVNFNSILTKNAATAPDGSATAASIADTVANSDHLIYHDNGVILLGYTNGFTPLTQPLFAGTCSVFLKAGTLSAARVQFYEGANNAGAKMDVDLANGVLANAGTIGSGSQYLGSGIQAVGGASGWYWVWLSAVIPNAANLYCITFTEKVLGTTTYVGDGSNIYAWGSQIVEKSRPYGYLSAVTIANLQLDSGNLARNQWAVFNGTQTPNSTTDPFNGDSATIVADDTTSGSHIFYHLSGAVNQPIAIAGTHYAPVVCSEYIKAGTRRYATLYCGDGGSSSVNGGCDSGVKLDLDLQAGTASGGGIFGSCGDSTSYTDSGIIDIGNGWYRAWVSGSLLVEADTYVKVYLADSLGNINYIGNGNTVYVYGPMVEEGTVLSDYMPVGQVPAQRITGRVRSYQPF